MSNHIGTTKVETASGVEEVPVFDPADLDETAWFRVETPAGTGAVRLVDVADADLPELRVQTPGGLRAVAQSLVELPDSVVTRPADNNTFSQDEGAPRGLRIETSVEWPEIGARISDNTASVTRAYVYRISDSQLLGDTDISALSTGDTFTIDLDSPLVSGETYSFVLDAEGASYTQGYYDSPSPPYDSSDGNISIVGGAAGSDGLSENDNDNCINDIGNTGF